jgi:uncharacterized protein YjbI with pentapeptide repeats
MQFRDPFGAHRNAGIPVVGSTWSDQRLANEDLAGVIFQDCVFERVRLERAILRQTTFLNSRFDDCIFDDCQVAETRWIGCQGSGLRISRGELSESLFSRTRLARLELAQTGRQIILAESVFDRFALNGAGCDQQQMTISDSTFGSFAAENATWRGGSALGIDFDTWSLDNARFDRCAFVRTSGNSMDFSSVRFESCNLYQSEFCEARFRWAEGSIFAECELARADFVEAKLKGALFAKSNAVEARFDRACLDGALFPKATLTGARFTGATAKQSVWVEADLTDANLEGVDAFRSTFRNAVLKRAEVTNTRFVEADLHGVEEVLDGADLRGSRKTVAWRAEREAQARAVSDG